MSRIEKETRVTYLVIDNGRPTLVAPQLDMAKGFARLRAGEGAYWQNGPRATTDRLFTKRDGIPHWTGWEIRPIPTL